MRLADAADGLCGTGTPPRARAEVPPSSSVGPCAAGGGARVAAWSLAAEDFLPHPVVVVEGLAPDVAAVAAALAATAESAAAARAGVFGVLLVLGPRSCTVMAAAYPRLRGAAAGDIAPALVSEAAQQLGLAVSAA
jgi:hypothetical protein